MSTPTGPAEPVRVPAPPGGHALHIDPEKASAATLRVEETSAGGLVVGVHDGVPQAAIIARRNRAGRLEWCLPKGHLEGAETPQEAAVREIAEETGIIGEIRHQLGVIDYWFGGDDRRVHKVVHHFLLVAVGGYLTSEHDPDHEVEDVEWVPLDALDARLSYPNERRLAATAAGLWSGPTSGTPTSGPTPGTPTSGPTPGTPRPDSS
ncbi:MAG: NUDIX hydrolase [Cellulomonas sp.]|jgi:8-oxo-dGTP pyrophosphatase MutT (NUDIX family)|nr:NUDIX hydrolase [Cellulomonas sp.]